MKLIIFFAISLFSFSLYSQDFKEDMNRLQKEVLNGFSCGLNYKLYKKESDKVYEETTGSYKSSSAGYYYNIGSTTYIGNEEEVVLINDDLSILSLLSSDVSTNLNTQLDFEKLSLLTDTVILINKTSSTLVYRMIFNPKLATNYDKIDVTINSITYLPMKTKIVFKTKINFSKDLNSENMGTPVISISYMDVKSVNIPKETFNTKKYYKKSTNGTFSGVGKYEDYEFHNQKHL